jgi:hypothetical protein
MTRLVRWVGVVVVGVGALYALALSGTFFGLPWWRFELGVFTYLDNDGSLGLWPVAIGLAWSPFLVRVRADWRWPFRLVAIGYAATALAGALCWLILSGTLDRSYAWKEFAQLNAAAAPLWISAAVAVALSMVARVDRRVAAALTVFTFWALFLAVRAAWVPYVIPYLRNIT